MSILDSDAIHIKTENMGVKRLKNKEAFLRNPPDNLKFRELFGFIWVQGIGNYLDEQGEPQPWADSTMADRFAEFGYDIDARSFQNWLSGKNKPSSKNIHRLARVISNDDAGYKNMWRDALTVSKIIPAKKPSEETETAQTEYSQIKKKRVSHFFALAGVFVTFLVLIGSLWRGSLAEVRASKIEVTNMKFCDEQRFSKTDKFCKTNVTHFPSGTKLVYVSFKIIGAPDGQRFDRRWYRNGELFLEKKDFYDAVWEDFTWLLPDGGFADAKYDLRIIINEKTETGTFFVGDFDDIHGGP